MYLHRSLLPFCFVSFFPYAITCLPALSSSSCFLFRFSTLFLYLPFRISCNTILHTYLHSHTCLRVAQAGYLNLAPFVTLCCVIYCFPNNLSQKHHVCTSNTIDNCLPSTCHSTTITFTTNRPAEMACAFVLPPRKPNSIRA